MNERSKKVIFVSHCILNQNTRAIGREKYPGVVRELTDLFANSDVGLIQLPCPQFEYSKNLDRMEKNKKSYNNGYRGYCRKLSIEILKQIENYLSKNYKILGIIGVEFSPNCGVYRIDNGSKNISGKGIFIEELENEMQTKTFQIPIIGANLNNISKTVEKLQLLLKAC